MPSSTLSLDGAQRTYFPPNDCRKSADKTAAIHSVNWTRSLLSNLYFLYLLFGKRCTDVFHYHLALTVNLKIVFSSPLQFCEDTSVTLSHLYSFISHNSSYLFCPFLTLMHTLLCFLEKLLSHSLPLRIREWPNAIPALPAQRSATTCCQSGLWQIPPWPPPSGHFRVFTAFVSPLGFCALKKSREPNFVFTVIKKSSFPKLDLKKGKKRRKPLKREINLTESKSS